MVAFSVVAYAAGPIVLIPDFIPVLGYLDDILLLPLGDPARNPAHPPQRQTGGYASRDPRREKAEAPRCMARDRHGDRGMGARARSRCEAALQVAEPHLG